MDSHHLHPEPDRISKFWAWFLEHRTDLVPEKASKSTIADLEEHLFAIHRLDWEIGPGHLAPNLFALSPRGDRQALEITRGIVALAPKLSDWEFYPAKPPRSWSLVFNLNVGTKSVTIDGKRWEFVAYKFDDGTYDLMLKPDNPAGLSAEYLNLAATIIVDGEIGEENRIDRVGNIELVTSWDEDAAKYSRILEPGLLASVAKRSGNQ